MFYKKVELIWLSLLDKLKRHTFWASISEALGVQQRKGSILTQLWSAFPMTKYVTKWKWEALTCLRSAKKGRFGNLQHFCCIGHLRAWTLSEREEAILGTKSFSSEIRVDAQRFRSTKSVQILQQTKLQKFILFWRFLVCKDLKN